MSRRPELFVESSALVALLLPEARGPAVAAALRRAGAVWMSALAPAETTRALLRAQVAGRIDASAQRRAVRQLTRLVAGARLIPVDSEILSRAAQPFGVEPVRTMDAIHLASLARARVVASRIGLLSLDDRVRDNADLEGVPLHPPQL